MLVKEGAGLVSPVPLDPAIKMAKGFSYGLGLDRFGLPETPISGNEMMHATGEITPAVASSCWSSRT